MMWLLAWMGPLVVMGAVLWLHSRRKPPLDYLKPLSDEWRVPK